MTSLAVMLVAPVVLGVDFGWQPVAGSAGIEFMIRLSPEQLEDLRNGEDVLSDLPPGMEAVHTYRITTDPSELPNEGKPPRKRQTALASTGQPMLDPVTGQTLPNSFAPLSNNTGPQPLGNNPYGNNQFNSSTVPGANPNSWNTNPLNNGLNNTTTSNGFNNRANNGSYLNQGGFNQQPLGNQSLSQQYGDYIAAPLNPNVPNYSLAANTGYNGYNPAQNNYVGQQAYPNPLQNNGLNNASFRPNGATLAGVTSTKTVSPANWIATIVALGLSLGANAYLGMLSIGLYNRCRVLLGQLRFSTLRG
jgi:hypothetical protein